MFDQLRKYVDILAGSVLALASAVGLTACGESSNSYRMDTPEACQGKVGAELSCCIEEYISGKTGACSDGGGGQTIYGPPPACKAGDTKCSNDKLFGCAEDGSYWNYIKDCYDGCFNDKTCNEVSADYGPPMPQCEAPATFCNDSSLYRCTDDGFWLFDRECREGCLNDIECKKEDACNDDNPVRCTDGELYTCVDGAWKFERRCEDGCNSDIECRDFDVPPTPGECNDGENWCTYETHEAALCVGGQWVEKKCTMGCTRNLNNHDNEDPCVENVTCWGDEIACNDDRTAVLTCKGSQYVARPCELGCYEGKCVEDIMPASTTCNEGEVNCFKNSLLFCAMGKPALGIACLNECEGQKCVDHWTCTPNESTCKDDILMTCQADGNTIHREYCIYGCENSKKCFDYPVYID